MAALGSAMAQRDFTCPVPSVADVPFRMVAAMRNWQRIALKWRVLAEGRCAHMDDLYRSGRWKRYYTEAEFLEELRHAATMAERWAKIVPRVAEREAADPPAEAA